MASSVVGVDISGTSLRAVELSGASKPQPTLLRFHEVSLPEGAVSRGEVLEAHTVGAALKLLWSEGGFKSKNVVLGIGNQRVLARDLSVPRATLKHIRESLPFQVQDMLPVPVADALLDFYPISESEGDSGPVINGLLIAAVKDAVLGNVSAVQDAGLTTVEVDLIPFALSRVLISRAHLPGTVALVDVGSNTTTVVIAVDGVPQFVRIIPAGGDDLTQALKSGLEIGTDEAERLKRTLGLATQVASVEEHRAVEIVYAVTSELLSSLRNTLSYFSNTRPQEPVRQIVLTGGGTQLIGFAKALTDMTHIPAAEADPFESISVAHSVKADALHQSRIAMTVALGLALGSAA
ncbi:MAG TPA: type IV pilus assembly protein PilM [Microbacteriaceae bacterium]|nr:type IV pilus assembly protein PilM [Microbacteriaceae bacterium]